MSGAEATNYVYSSSSLPVDERSRSHKLSLLIILISFDSAQLPVFQLSRRPSGAEATNYVYSSSSLPVAERSRSHKLRLFVLIITGG
jgi:hypothetical protein